jgi:hypothetical protein
MLDSAAAGRKKASDEMPSTSPRTLRIYEAPTLIKAANVIAITGILSVSGVPDS